MFVGSATLFSTAMLLYHEGTGLCKFAQNISTNTVNPRTSAWGTYVGLAFSIL